MLYRAMQSLFRHLGIRHSFDIRHSSFVILAVSYIALGACRKPEVTKTRLDPDSPVEVVLPAKGAYTGAFMDFGDAEDEVTIEMIEDFEKMVGKHQAIIASSSYWGEQSFPTRNLNVIWRHGALPLVFWSPWDRPYEQNHGPDKFNINAITEGKWDEYIDKWGDAAREFGNPMIVAFANEMNGDWFPWSGWYYGADKLTGDKPNQWEGPEHFKAAYRHVVDRVRARGAANIKWMFHTNNYSYPLDTWNFAAAYYPGPEYADWLGISVYGQQFKDERGGDSGVTSARSSLALKSADTAAVGASQSGAAFMRRYGLTASPQPPTAAPAQDTTQTRVARYSQQSQYVAGKTFFQNDKQWIDSAVQKNSSAKHVRLLFGSDDYFAFLARHPQAAPWLALGQNLQLVLDNTIYEIYE